MIHYILAALFAATVAGIPVVLNGTLPAYWGLMFAAVVYIGFGIFNCYYAYDLVIRLDRLSKSGHPVAKKMVENIVNNEVLIKRLMDGVISVIIFLVLSVAGYFYLPFTIVAVAAAAFFMFKSTDMIDLVGNEIKKL